MTQPLDQTGRGDDAPREKSPVQQHVDQILDDLSAGRLSPKQRGEVGKGLSDAAVASIGKRPNREA